VGQLRVGLLISKVEESALGNLAAVKWKLGID